MLPTLLKNSFKYTKYYNDFNNSVYDCRGVDLCRNGEPIVMSLDYELHSDPDYDVISVPDQHSSNVLYLYTFYVLKCRHISNYINTDDQWHIVNLNGKLEISTDFEDFSGYVQYLTTVYQIKVQGSIVDISCYVFKPV